MSDVYVVLKETHDSVDVGAVFSESELAEYYVSKRKYNGSGIRERMKHGEYFIIKRTVDSEGNDE